MACQKNISRFPALLATLFEMMVCRSRRVTVLTPHFSDSARFMWIGNVKSPTWQTVAFFMCTERRCTFLRYMCSCAPLVYSLPSLWGLTLIGNWLSTRVVQGPRRHRLLRRFCRAFTLDWRDTEQTAEKVCEGACCLYKARLSKSKQMLFSWLTQARKPSPVRRILFLWSNV